MTDSIFGDDNATNKEVNSSTTQNSDTNQGSGTGLTAEEFEKVRRQNAHAQTHIKTLETETAAYRAEIARLKQQVEESARIEALLSRMDESTTDRTTPVDVGRLAEQVKDEVVKSLTDRQVQEAEAANVSKSVQELQKIYGDTYKDAVRKRAEQLGITVAHMDGLAKSSPKALLELMGTQQQNTPASTRSSTNSNVAPILSGEQLSDQYFAKVRKENKKLWSTPEFQHKYRQYLINNVINK